MHAKSYGTPLRVSQDTLERVHEGIAQCYLLDMDDKWFERLVEAVERDERDMKAISKAAHLGENYVQQMVKNRKKPKIDSLVKLMKALGRADTLYVVTGTEFSEADRRLLEIASLLDEARKKALIDAFAALAETQL